MAKKKKRRGPRPAAEPASTPAGRGGANVARRERKEEARKAREAELRRARRSSAVRRTVTSFAIAAAAIGAITLFRAVSGPNPIPEAAQRAATAAGCTEVEQPAASAEPNQHLTADQLPYTYEDTPATSGFHEQSWISEPKVFDTPAPETRAVHSLEHGAVFVYYLPPETEGGLPQEVVDRLAGLANQDRATFLAPYPTLTPERALTITAWNRRQSCPAGAELTAQTAATIVNGFVEAFECTSNAPEGSNSPC
jgi:hypothetical protein